MGASKTSFSNRFLTNEQMIFHFDVSSEGGSFNDVTHSSKFTLIYAILTLILGLPNC